MIYTFYTLSMCQMFVLLEQQATYNKRFERKFKTCVLLMLVCLLWFYAF